MIPELGLISLILAFCSALSLAFVAPMGLISSKFEFLQKMSKSAAFAQMFFVLISFLTLVLCFVQDDFSVSYVAQNSNTHLPLIYKICAVWGAHEGSLLLWSLILTFWTFAVAFVSKTIPDRMLVAVLAVLGAINVGFLFLLLHTSNPFIRLLPFAPLEGSDLNPLLQDPGFIIHPPFLYMGYVGFAVPFAYAISYMMLRQEKWPFAQWARPWALLAWSFLTIGITLGSWWAYYELGWGGWWFWDPVENASFMPWLVGAALAHALLITINNPAYNAWSLILSMSAFVLSLIGTFLVRSGVLSSVHAFASDPLRGTFILSFVTIVLAVCVMMYMSRKPIVELKSSAIVSKESIILLGNVILFSATLTVLLGTLYPLAIEVLYQEQISVGPPYFNLVFTPMVLPLLWLLVLATQLHWHQDSMLSALKRMTKFILVFVVFAIPMIILMNAFSLMSIIAALLSLWVIVGTVFKFGQQLKSGTYRISLQSMGLYFGHLGIGIAVLGMALTSTLSQEKEFTLSIGESVIISPYQFVFSSVQDIHGANFEGIEGHFIIKKDDTILTNLFPQKRYFIPRNIPMTETAISPGLLRDFYIALGEKLEDGSWTVRIYIKPFVRWIWLGGILISLGAFCASMNGFRKLSLYPKHLQEKWS